MRNALAEQLRTHRAATELEAAHVKRMLALAASESPFARTNFTPGHFTASAFVLSPQRDALLLILHRKLGLWLQPGGHVEAQDLDLLAAARREVEEEVGLSALEPILPGIFDVDIHPIAARASEAAHEHFDVRYLLRAASRDLRAGSEIQAAQWIPLAKVGAVQSDESVLRAVRKLHSIAAGSA